VILGVAGSNPVGRPIFSGSMYYVYILVCLKTGRSYVGHTDHLIRRFAAHQSGSTRTSREKLLEPAMLHWEAQPSRAAAMQRERYYKSGSGHRVKQALINSQLKILWPDA
jgi:predicted GIY-YIG superfamily endonuclease